MTRVAIIAAFPGELKPLVRNWPHSTRDGTQFWAQRGDKKEWEEEWIAACAGAGQSAATRAFAAIEAGGPIDLVFSIGWAGALRPAIAPGTAHNVAGVIDVRTGERFNCDAGAGELWLATSPTVADAAEKTPPRLRLQNLTRRHGSRRRRASRRHARHPLLLH